MEESDKYQLEGLLQARSEDLRQGRVRRRRRAVADVAVEPPVQLDDVEEPSARACAECGDAIAPRRLRALPRAARCLPCQRASERPATPS